MQVRSEQVHLMSEMVSLQARQGNEENSVTAFVRHWGPYILTALLVPGGIVVALLLLWRHWNKKRQAVASPARA